MSSKKFFDLHFEIGNMPDGHVYARVMIDGNPPTEFKSEERSVVNAVAAVALQLDAVGLWQKLATKPQISLYPLDKSKSIPKANNGKRLRPSDLTQVPHPDCQSVCTAYDIFGKARCKSICAQRSGV